MPRRRRVPPPGLSGTLDPGEVRRAARAFVLSGSLGGQVEYLARFITPAGTLAWTPAGLPPRSLPR